MRILFLTSQFPYPPDNGARIKTLSILEHLRPRHEVQFLCLTRQEPDEEQRRWANVFGHVRWVRLDRGRNPLNLARSYASGLPLSVERNRSAEMSALVQEAVASGRPDAIFVDGWLMAQYLPDGFPGLKVLHEHNAEYVIWERQAQLETGVLRRTLVRREAQRVRRYEASLLGRFDRVFAVSDEDRAALLAIGADPTRTGVLPNVPDASLLEMPPLSFEAAPPTVLYFGTLSWLPNIEGLERFITQVFPLVRKEVPQTRFLLAGMGAPARIEKLAWGAPGVDYLGPASDPETLYRKARVFVEATRSGGGTKLKVLNALARGLPVAASPEAVEGIDAIHEAHLLTGADDHALAGAVVRLLSDASLWERLSAGGRLLIGSRYTAEAAFGALDEALTREQARA